MSRVVVVDDEPAVAKALTRLLTSHGFDVCTCLSAASALAELRARPADVVVSDFHMPGMDGVALLAEVKRCWPATCRVLISALATTLSVEALVPCAPCGVVPKPFRDEELLRAVRGKGG
ncbi:MAG: hypothetical protein AMXMBFR34_17990 [Myxococcaceae bacterium]